ncbi:glycosyltransferase [Chitinophagaceae bacterium 26-R-25]|nr:glycosyltransferase [Chitinophagaceae bacterium 26-R-25]
MKNILFVAYEFPPLRLGGVFRSLAFVKYLREFGINPVVLTLDPKSYNIAFEEYAVDEGLGKDVIEKADMELIPTSSLVSNSKSKLKNFTDIFFSINGQEGEAWKPFVNERIGSIIKKYSPVAIYVTTPPISVIPVFKEIAAANNLPLIIDFRDAWSQWRVAPYATRLHYWLTLYYERKYLESATAVIGTSNQTLNDFKSLHPHVPPQKFHYIPNGFDADLAEWTPIAANKEQYTIGYVGSFYYSPESTIEVFKPWWKKRGHRMLQYVPDKQDWLYRSPYFFFKALQELFTLYPEWRKKIKVKFVGKVPGWLNSMIEEFSLQENIELLGLMSHKDALAFQRSVDALLITSAKRLQKPDYSIAGKTFEYFQMQKPILGFVCEGSQKEILEASGTTLICDPDNAAESARKIVGLFNDEIHLQPDIPFLEGLHRKVLTKKLADVINSVK